MKKITFKKMLLLFSFLCSGNILMAQVQTAGSYVPLGDTLLSYVTTDADNGDGANDGAILVDGQSVVVGQGTIFTFDGRMQEGNPYNINTAIYNPGGSFTQMDLSLYNLTDGVELSFENNIGPAGGAVVSVSTSYTALASDEGDVLQLRFVRDQDGNTSRDFAVDFITLNGTTVKNTDAFGSWNSIGDVFLIGQTNDGDNGDGANDGTLYVDGQSAVAGQGVIFVLDRTTVAGKGITIASTIFNPNGSFCGVRTGLYNKTDNLLLSSLQDSNLGGGAIDAFTLNYTTVASDVGDILEIRFIRDDDGNAARNFSIDVLNINGEAVNTDVNMWDGSSNSNWTTTSNWTKNSLPSATEDVVIRSLTPNSLTIQSTTSSVAQDFVVMSGAIVTISAGGSLIVNGESSGEITYNRELTFLTGNTAGWHLVSSPVKNETYDNDYATANSLATSSTKRGLATYTTTLDSWSYLEDDDSNEGIFKSGTGYSLKRSLTGSVGFTGTINTAPIGVDTAVILGGTGGFNLVGNPYTSYVNSATFLTANTSKLVSETIWLWNPATGNYETKVTGDGFVLAPGQGFFVRANAANNLNFAESNQTSSADTFQKSSKTSIMLSMTDSESNRFARINYLDNATLGFDNGFDGETFGGIPNSIDIFTALVSGEEGKKYQVQSVPNSDFENMVVPVGVKATAGKEITFTVTAQNLPSGLNIFLEDRELNTFTSLNNTGTNYKVTLTDAVNGIGRFYLHTASKALSTDTEILNNISVFKSNNNNLRINGLENGEAKIKVFTILGKQVLQHSFVANGSKNITLPNLDGGIYIVQLESRTGKLNKKIIIE